MEAFLLPPYLNLAIASFAVVVAFLVAFVVSFVSVVFVLVDAAVPVDTALCVAVHLDVVVVAVFPTFVAPGLVLGILLGRRACRLLPPSSPPPSKH